MGNPRATVGIGGVRGTQLAPGARWSARLDSRQSGHTNPQGRDRHTVTVSTAYLAARYSRREELCGYRADLAERGVKVPARWLNGDHQIDNQGLSVEAGRAARTRFATEDLSDVLSADLLIAFTEPPRSSNSRGGRHVEFGVAIGRGIPVIVVGPRENVFHCLLGVPVYATWEEALTDPRLAGDRVTCGSTAGVEVH